METFLRLVSQATPINKTNKNHNITKKHTNFSFKPFIGMLLAFHFNTVKKSNVFGYTRFDFCTLDSLEIKHNCTNLNILNIFLDSTLPALTQYWKYEV